MLQLIFNLFFLPQLMYLFSSWSRPPSLLLTEVVDALASVWLVSTSVDELDSSDDSDCREAELWWLCGTLNSICDPPSSHSPISSPSSSSSSSIPSSLSSSSSVTTSIGVKPNCSSFSEQIQTSQLVNPHLICLVVKQQNHSHHEEI